MKKTILLVGGLGYIGSGTAYMLHEQGYHIVILDKLVHHCFQATFPWAHVVKGDYRNRALLRVLFNEYHFDAVMHFAGLIEVGQSVIHPDLFYANNVVGTLSLLDVMHEYAVGRIIFSSSCAVYGNPLYVPIDEAHPCVPVNPYGRTKLSIEYALGDYAQAFDMRYAVLRYFNAAGALPEYGLGECHNPETHVIPLLLQAALCNRPFKIFGTDYATSDGTCVRDYIHVGDIARAHVLALDYLMHDGASDIFNLGTGDGCTVRDLVYTAQEVCKCAIQTTDVGRRQGDVAVLVAQAAKAQKTFGWQPQRSNLITIIQDALMWERQRQGLCGHYEQRDITC